MERAKKILLFIIVLSGILLFIGCDYFSFRAFKNEEDNPVVTVAPDNDTQAASDIEQDNQEITDKKTSSTEPNITNTEIQPAETVDLPLYSVNITSGETESITATIPKDTKITPELIVEKVVEAMDDRSLEVGVRSVITKDDAVIVDFYKDKAPLNELGYGYETAILDAIAMSLIDNLEDYNKVFYEAEGEAYVSDHVALDKDEPYLTR